MNLGQFILKTRLLLEQVLYELRNPDSQFDTARPVQATPLEERILFSASPVAVLTDAANLSAGAAASDAAELSDARLLDLLADVVLPARSSESGRTAADPTTADAGTADSGGQQSATDTEATHELIIIDGTIAGVPELLDELGRRTEANPLKSVDVMVLESSRNGIQQITELLSEYHGIDAIHIVTQPDRSRLQLGSVSLTADTLRSHHTQLSLWQQSIAPDSNIVIYGSGLSDSSAGRAVLEELAWLTQANVFTSEDLYADELQNLTITSSGEFAGEATVDHTTVFQATFSARNIDATTTLVTAVPRQLVFVDEAVYDYQSIAGDLINSPAINPADVFVLRSDRDGLDQISHILSVQTQPVDSIHFLSHGTFGAVKLGATWVTNDVLSLRGSQIAAWSAALSDSADLLFYGCDLAGNTTGTHLLETIASLTGADVAASVDATGAGTPEGNWILEYQLGQVETSVAVSNQLQQSWNGLMATFTVTNTNDSGAGSLRQAIIDANALAGTDTITFNIATTDPGYVDPTPASPNSGDEYWTIALSSGLPYVTESVVIDGWSQPGYTQTPVIEIDGSGAGSAYGLYLNTGSGGSTVRGLVINQFNLAGLYIWTGAAGSTIVGNSIGTDVTGSIDLGNGSGIVTSSSSTIIGGSTLQERNIIAGNGGNGIQLANGSSNNIIQGNLIGIGSGGEALGNGTGIAFGNLSSSGTLVGGTNAGEGNVIAFNSGIGIRTTTGTGAGNSFLGNLIYANSGIGIDLSSNGVTINDAGDADTGPNGLQNFPVITSATSAAGGTTVAGTLNSSASTTYRIEFFSTPDGSVDGSGHGEGQRYLGFTTVTTDGLGDASFNVLLSGVPLAGPDTVTATATVDSGGSYGSTSEFAANVAATGIWYGTTDDDTLTGGSNDDQFEALFGSDTISSGGGNDMINADDVTVADMLTADPTLQYDAVRGKFYKLISTAASWADAKAAAEAMSVLGIQGRLVTINSADENTFVQSVAAGNSIWLGASDTGHQDAYVWVSGEAVTYQNFAPGQPDGSQWADGLLMQSNGTWLDSDETTSQKYIVEFAPLAHADVITGGAGNDTIEGGIGRDTAIFSSVSTDYTITDNGNGTWTVTDNRGGSPDGADLLSGVEQFRFTDLTYDTTLNAFNSAPTDLDLTTPGNDLVAQPITDLQSYTGFNGIQHNAVSLAGGGYAIIYSTYDYNSSFDLMVQKYDAADNPVGDPYLLDRDMLSYAQYETDVAVLTSGNIVVTWRDSGYDGNADGIFFKLLDSSLNALSGKIQANTTTWSYQQEPDISATGDGGFVITWRGYADENSDGVADFLDVYAQKFDANGTKIGSEIVVDDRTNNQYQPSVAGFTDGSFLVVYRNDNTAFSDGSGGCILGQYYDASGVAVGGRFIVNTTTSGTQHDTQSLSLAGNKVLVTYRQSDGSSNGIFGKIYDSTGTLLKDEFLLNVSTTSDQWNAELRALSDGSFIVIYVSADSGSNYRVLAQRYDNAGNAIGSELGLAPYSASYRQQAGTVVELTSGELVFSWQKASGFSLATMTDDVIWRQRYSLSGVSYVAESEILETQFYQQVTSMEEDITPLATGGHVVVWRNQGIEPSGGTSWGVIAQIFDGTGVAIGSPFSLAQANQTSHQYNPVVSATPDGGFVAAWQSDGSGGDGNSFGVRVAKYDGSGTLQGSEILVNTTTSGAQEVPAVNVASDGSFVVTWRTLNQGGAANGYDVYMQRFDASGNKLGGETLVNATTANHQLYQEVSTNADGKSLVVWADSSGDSSGYGVYGKIYDASGSVVASDFLINTDFQSSTQHLPAVATLNDGRFIAVWQSYTEDGSRYTAVGRIINADGTFATGHIQLNEWTAADQSNVEVARLNNGGFVATWTSSGDGRSFAVWGRMFDSSGLATSDEFRVSDTPTGWGYKPRVAQRSDGSLIFVWSDYDPSVGSVVRQRIYTPGLIASTNPDAVIGQFTATDPDPNETFTYEIIAADTTDFELIGNLLAVKNGAVFDPINDPPRNITVRVTDSVGNTYDEIFTINPTPVNQTPTSLTFTPSVTAENAANGTVVGTAIGGDPDIGDTLTYSLIFDAGGRFAIDSNTGEVTVANASLLDFDSAATHSITIKATDTGNLAIIKAFTITLSNVNENSTDIFASGPGANLVTNGSFESDLTGWTATGSVGAGTSQSPTDGTKQVLFNSGGQPNDGVLSQDITTVIGQTYTVLFDYAAYGAATAQTLRFEVEGASSLINQTLVSVGASPTDHRTYAFTFVADSTTTTLRFSDEGSNAASTDIDLDNVRMYAGVPTIAENSTGGTHVAWLGANDPDGHDDVTFSLVGGDTTNFEVVGNELRVKSGATLDFETNPTPTVTVRSTDELGLTHDEVITIAVTDVNDAPIIGNISFGTATWSGSTSKTVVGAWNGTADQQYLVDTAGSYLLRFTGVSDSAVPLHYAGLAPYDVDGAFISPYNYLQYAGSVQTTLAVDLLPGATTIQLTDATGWYNGPTSHFRSLGWFPYVDSLGDSYGTDYTRNIATQIWSQSGISGNTITLDSPWSGPALSAGTQVANIHSGGNYLYTVLGNQPLATTPTEYTDTITGLGGNSYDVHQFPPGTAYVSPLVLTNHNGSGPTNTVTWSNVSLESTDWKLAAFEHTATSTSMGSVLGSDADAGDSYTWSLTDDADGLFAIDSITGEITVAGTLPDFEASPVLTVTVRLTDAGGLYDEQAVSIRLVDLQTITTVTTTADNNDAGLQIGNAAHTTKWLYDNRGTDGEISLREAIIATNNTVNWNGNPDEIRFNISTSDTGYNLSGLGVFTIQPTSALPTLTDAVIIDGTTQWNFVSSPVIELDGSNAGGATEGFTITGGGTTIRGFAINGFDGDGIQISGDGLNTIEGNYIGVRATGDDAIEGAVAWWKGDNTTTDSISGYSGT
ncbi:MAG: DUF4347 domain-containing protein, partial [Planctomycetaceae bacterium]|nr:DUF4347 domain-containing protein [Planctomycetaceae bacterium]